ncbi:amino acid adenylation domain-containing protein [Marinobacter bryozoorum]|uniref:amino acid adenylation domain-containing protein n=1 Tax=Marinobacter bryozoorum TaxID=256324 RepID=UPI0020034EE6|nr:amino acid adenylation domain-containing protein [Marinobacter bryozoorum]MCK7544046.1 amino acid adenylation domain-containing protein [Marinobacter bryozoorum]
MTQTDPSVIERFVDIVDRFPDRPALWARNQTYTYRELSAIAEATRLRLCEQDVGIGEQVGVMTGDGVETYAAILGIMAAGAAYVPINGKNPLTRNLEIIDDAEVSALVFEEADELAERLSEGSSCKLVQAASHPAKSGLRPSWQSAPELAYLLFTSGSTGKPKGVPIRHDNLSCFLSIMLDSGLYDIGPEDRCLQMFELTFDFSVMSTFVPLCAGACCYVLPQSRFGAATVLKMLQEHELTVAPMVPSILVFLEPFLESRVRLPSLRLSLFCGEALPDSLARKWTVAAPNGRVENLYGPTEATVFCLRYLWQPDTSPAEAVNGVVPIGAPFPRSRAVILEESGTLSQKVGARGELLLMGEQLSTGYWKDPAKTEAAFITIDYRGERDMAYRTGDICSIDERENFIYHGRLDAQVKVDGFRVELGEIEHHVRQLLDRTSIAVVAASDKGRTYLALFIERPEVDLERLRDELKARVPMYMVPQEMVFVERLPLNLNGKVDRPALVRSLMS